MAVGDNRVRLSGKNPKLNRSSSSLAINSASSATSSSSRPADARDKFRRKGVNTGSFADSISEEQPRVPPEGTNFTITDLFLQDLTKGSTLADSASQGIRPFIPLPPGVSPGLMQLQREEVKNQNDLGTFELNRKAVLEHSLENYFKPHAMWPHFPKLEERRKRVKAFREQFHGGELDQTIVRHCGEHLKCTAFVVVSVEKVGVRSSPSFSDEAQTGEVLYPGQMVMVNNILTFNKVKFLKLNTGGWVFNRKGNKQVMSYMSNVEMGMWWYRVVSQEFAEVREAPSESERARSGFVLVPGEVCVIGLRCLIDSKQWMNLADGRGWIFEMRPENAPQLTGLADDGVQEVVMAEIKQGLSVDLDKEESAHSKATNIVEVGMWEYEIMQNVLAIGASVSGWMLRRGDKIFVDMRVPANGQKEKKNAAPNDPLLRIWLRLNDGRGWLPKTDVAGVPIVRFRKQASVEQRLTVGKLSSAHSDDVEGWKTGVA